MLRARAVQELVICKWNLPWKSGCELVKHSLAEVLWGLTCCSPAQVLCVKKEKVIKVIICLHLEVMLQCQTAELSSQPGMSRAALPWSLRPFLFTDLPFLSHCPLGETPCYSWDEIPGISAQFHWGFWGMTLLSPSPRKACGLWVDHAVMSAEHQSSAWQTSEGFRGFISSAK